MDSISVISRLQRLDLHYTTPKLLAVLFDLERTQAYSLLNRLKDKGLVAPVENGKYLVLGLKPEQVLTSPMFIAVQLATPAYVSYWTALHHFGFTEQVPNTIFVATTQKKRPVEFQGQTYRFVKLKPHKFFGYRREMIGGLPVVVADEAKALVDSLDQLRYAGGIVEVARALAQATPEIELDLLIEYAIRMKDRSLSSRLGYLLDQLGHRADGLPISSSPVLLDPGGPAAGPYDSRRRIRNNIPANVPLISEGVV